MTDITVIILTFNEALHIRRAIASVAGFASRVLVVDSGSDDGTVALSRSAGAQVLQHSWTNHATQFNWALDQISDRQGWVLRLDADELVTPELAAAIKGGLPEVAGIYLDRRISFMGRPIRYGGLFPVQVMRLFRNGAGRCEDRWMDEHIVVDGPTGHLPGEILDDNRKPLDWWIDKHNNYASREVVDVICKECGLASSPPLQADLSGSQVQVKRWLKTNLYAHLPNGTRAALYFFYRYVLRFGFLDGPEGRRFHVLQGFWYRYLVDAKLVEVRKHMALTSAAPEDAIRYVLGIDLRSHPMDRRDAA